VSGTGWPVAPGVVVVIGAIPAGGISGPGVTVALPGPKPAPEAAPSLGVIT
jgi:hypothetical protein